MLRSEVALRERATGTGFQVLLEAESFSFSRKFQRDNNRPRTMVNRPATWAVVVPLESFFDITRHTDVMVTWVAIASKDIDKPIADTSHARRERTDEARAIPQDVGRFAKGSAISAS